MESFNVIDCTESFEQVIDKSRFIGVIIPINVIEDIQKNLQSIRDRYPDARHYVYAYRIKNGQLEKSSDDGEPQGTGGKPVLDVLQYAKLWNVLLVVVRYFGGILLGTGGLTRAYGGTARLLLEQVPIKSLHPHSVYKLKIPYTWYEALKYHFKLQSWTMEKEEFSEMVNVLVYIPQEDSDSFEVWLNNFTSGQVLYKNDGINWRVKKN